MALILDTGVVYSALDRSEKEHEECRALIDNATEMRLIPAATLPEIDYLLSQRVGPGAMVALVQDIRDGAFVVEDLEFEDYQRVEELIDKYADSDIGFVDAAVMAITERLREPKLATLDNRHFSLMRPRHVESLQLLPS